MVHEPRDSDFGDDRAWSDRCVLAYVTASMAVIVAMVAIALALIAMDRSNQYERRLHKFECAFIIYEDGSAGIRTDDAERFACMYQEEP